MEYASLLGIGFVIYVILRTGVLELLIKSTEIGAKKMDKMTDIIEVKDEIKYQKDMVKLKTKAEDLGEYTSKKDVMKILAGKSKAE